MPLYETIFIARQDVAAPQVEALTKTFGDIVTGLGGKVAKTEQWGLRNLAYRINKNKKGHYVMFNLEASPAAIAEMERNMSLHEDIMRFLTIRVEEHEVAPSAVLRKDERSERPAFGDRDRGGDRGGGDRGGGDRGDRPRRGPRPEAAVEGEVA